MEQLDKTDIEILEILQEHGRISNTDLAQRVGLAPPTVLRRVKILEERGYIRGYAALLNPLLLGQTVTAFILIETTPNADLDCASREFANLPGAQELHRMIGEWCFLLKVRTASPQTLEDLIYRDLRRHPAVRRTHTMLATSAPYETTHIALPQLPAQEPAHTEPRGNQ